MERDRDRSSRRDRPRASVLIVDDEPQITELYREYLDDRYDVETAGGGEEALELVDDHVDVVLLDRRMPDLDGDTVLETIRERDLNCRVVMITAINPDFDIIDMEFDDYISKPATQDEIIDAVERQLVIDEYDTRLQEYHRLGSKIDALEAEKTEAELAQHDSYQMLTVLRDSLEEELQEMLAEHDELDEDALSQPSV